MPPAARHLYCLESNRACFRRLFSPDLFAAFIDIGAYQQQLQQYLPLAQELHGLPAEQRQRLAAALEEARAAQAAGVKDAGGYRLLEVLGQGGFGAVYRACRCGLLRAGSAAAAIQFSWGNSLMAAHEDAPCQVVACLEASLYTVLLLSLMHPAVVGAKLAKPVQGALHPCEPMHQ